MYFLICVEDFGIPNLQVFCLRMMANLAYAQRNIGIDSGLLANSSADRDLQRVLRNELQGPVGDDLVAVFTDLGDIAQPLNSAPIYLGAIWGAKRR